MRISGGSDPVSAGRTLSSSTGAVTITLMLFALPYLSNSSCNCCGLSPHVIQTFSSLGVDAAGCPPHAANTIEAVISKVINLNRLFFIFSSEEVERIEHNIWWMFLFSFHLLDNEGASA